MRPADLRHVLRAAAGVSGEKKLLIIGSISVLGRHPDAPHILTMSDDVDIVTPLDPAKSDDIDGAIGEMSQFHHEFGVYAHGVSPETAILPADWEDRVVRKSHEDLGEVELLFLSPVDAAYSKLAAGREKDFEWVRELFHHHLANQGELARLIARTAPGPLQDKLTRNFTVALGRKPGDVSSDAG